MEKGLIAILTGETILLVYSTLTSNQIITRTTFPLLILISVVACSILAYIIGKSGLSYKEAYDLYINTTVMGYATSTLEILHLAQMRIDDSYLIIPTSPTCRNVLNVDRGKILG